MSFAIKVIFLVVLIAGATAFFLQDPERRNLDFIKQMFPDLKQEQQKAKDLMEEVKDQGKKLKKSLGPEVDPGEVRTLYKWKDDNGVWQFSQEPPPDRQSEQVIVDPRANIVPSENL